MKHFEMTIPLNPRPKKNTQEIVYVRGKPLIVQNKNYKKFQSDCGKYIRFSGEPISTPVSVKYTFFRGTKHRVDETNLEEAMDDILAHYGVLKDDCRDIVVNHDGTRVLYDKENPRIEIEITDYDEPYEQWSDWTGKEKIQKRIKKNGGRMDKNQP